MRKLPILGIVLIVAGLALVLYSDPAVGIASGHAPTQLYIGANASTSGGPGLPPGGQIPSDCTQGPNGHFQCGTLGGTKTGTATVLTVAGIALCGAGLFAGGVDAVSRSDSQPRSEKVA